MKNFKNFGKRGLSLFVALMMSLSILSVTALADDEITDTPSDPVPVEPVALADEPADPPVVAMIGEQTYTSIEAALKAAGENETTITLVAQEGATAENPTKITEEVQIGKGQNITLDIPENVQLQNTEKGADKVNGVSGSTLYVSEGGTLIVTGQGTVVSQCQWANGFALTNAGGTVELRGCTFVNDNWLGTMKRSHYVIQNTGTMDIYEGTKVTSEQNGGADTQIVNGYASKGDVRPGTLTVHYIEMFGTKEVGIWNSAGSLTVNDGKFDKAVCIEGSGRSDSNTVINGGTFTGRENIRPGDGNLGLVYFWGNGPVEINGGTFKTYKDNDSAQQILYEDDDSKKPASVSGGYFDGEIDGKFLKKDAEGVAEVVCINVEDGSATPYQVGYLTLTDTDTNRLLYTNLGDGTTTMVPTFALQNGKDLNGLDRSKATSITWTTSDDSIASVDDNGHVTARSNGEVTIVATYEVNGKKVSQEYKVTVDTVYVPVYVEDFVFTPTDDSTGTTIADQTVPLAGLVTLAELLNALHEYEGIEDVELPEDFQWIDHEYAQAIYWGLQEELVFDTEDDPLDPDEIVTVAILREVLENYVEYKGIELTVTVEGEEDDEIVFNLGERLTAFYGELEAALKSKAA